MKVNKNLFLMLATVGWILNSLGTLIFLWARANTFIDKIYALGITILLEPAMYAFFIIFLMKKIPNGIRIVCCCIWVVLTIATISATSSYMMNIDNYNKNQALKNSSEYKEVESKKSLLSQDVESKRAEIEVLKQDKINAISAMTKDKDSLPRDYLSAKADLQLKINATSDKLQKKIDDKVAAIDGTINELKNTSTTTITLKQTEGYSSYFSAVCELLNGQGAKMTVTQLELIFCIMVFGVIPLAIGNMGYYFYNNFEKYFYKEIPINSTYVDKNDIAGQLPVPTVENKVIDEIELKKLLKQYENFPNEIDCKGKIGFQTPKTNESFTPQTIQPINEFSDDDLKIYWNYMQTNKDGNISPGYIKISSETTLPVEVCRKIKAYLERIQAIEVKGNKTMILKDKLKV